VEEHHNSLFFPLLRPGGDVLGVVRCSDKYAPEHVSHRCAFTDDDVAVLDAISPAIPAEGEG
jgi:hypothetical protein